MTALLQGRGFLVDLDGTLVSGTTVLPDARRLLDAIVGRFAILSNNAEHTPLQLARMLRRLGLRVPEDRIVLAGTAALDVVAIEWPGARILLLGSAALQNYARRLGLRPGEAPAEVVVVARDRHFSYARLAAAANAARAGAALVVCNPDRTHPGLNGAVVPETGALFSSVLACAGPVGYRVIGKPEAALFRAGMALLGTSAAETVMIGDNPETDGVGAERLGMGFVHVRGGRLPAMAAVPT